MVNRGHQILQLLSEAADVAAATQNKPLAGATAKVLDAMLNDGLIGPKEDWVYQVIMHHLFQSGVLQPPMNEGDISVHEMQWLM